jgi:hypothetical protein
VFANNDNPGTGNNGAMTFANVNVVNAPVATGGTDVAGSAGMRAPVDSEIEGDACNRRRPSFLRDFGVQLVNLGGEDILAHPRWQLLRTQQRSITSYASHRMRQRIQEQAK